MTRMWLPQRIGLQAPRAGGERRRYQDGAVCCRGGPAAVGNISSNRCQIVGGRRAAAAAEAAAAATRPRWYRRRIRRQRRCSLGRRRGEAEQMELNNAGSALRLSTLARQRRQRGRSRLLRLRAVASGAVVLRPTRTDRRAPPPAAVQAVRLARDSEGRSFRRQDPVRANVLTRVLENTKYPRSNHIRLDPVRAATRPAVALQRVPSHSSGGSGGSGSGPVIAAGWQRPGGGGIRRGGGCIKDRMDLAVRLARQSCSQPTEQPAQPGPGGSMPPSR
jgi:hypothetical protein